LTLPSAAAARLKRLAREHGFDRVSFTNADVLTGDLDFFRDWLAGGNAAEMDRWLARDPARRGTPGAFLPGALGVVSLGISYWGGAAPPAPGAPYGRVARYAWGLDYHVAIERRARSLAAAFAAEVPGLSARPAVDAQPLLERAFARRSGLGFVGKNTNLIVPGAGSWFFLAELVVSVPLPEDPPVRQGCGGCTSCKTACPTDALSRDFSLDARRCVSYHTIENRGSIPPEFRPGLGDWLFGCDDCQEACPFNARPFEALWPEFSPSAGAGAWLSLAEVLSLRTPEAFNRRFAGTPLLRAKRGGLVRNACVVARNRGAVEELRELLRERLEDENEAVREAAGWALEGSR
jgi:epoxyqueuosine reductase